LLYIVAARSKVKSWTEGDKRNVWELSGLRDGDIIDPDDANAKNTDDDDSNWPNNTVVYKFEPGMRKSYIIQVIILPAINQK